MKKCLVTITHKNNVSVVVSMASLIVFFFKLILYGVILQKCQDGYFFDRQNESCIQHGKS